MVDRIPILLTLIPARGGSKGLPGKNVRRLGDLPLLAWSHEAWRQAGLPGECWLSTDDEELARVGRAAGISVPFLRPAALASDTASTAAVALHAVDFFANLRGAEPEWLLILQPTSPLRPPAALRDGWARAEVDDCDGVVGMKFIYRTPATMFYSDDGGFVHAMSNDAKKYRRQDLRPLLTPNGALYFVRVSALRKERTAAPKKTVGLVMDAIASIDIDDAVDWGIADALVRCGYAWRTQ